MMEWMALGEGTSRVGGAGAGLLAVQVFRVIVAGFAFAWWLRIVKPSLLRNWKGVMIAIAVVVAALSEKEGARIAAFVIAFIPLWKMRWTDELHGWSRLGMLFLSLIVWLIVSINTSTVISDGTVSDPVAGLPETTWTRWRWRIAQSAATRHRTVVESPTSAAVTFP